ncbi:MAG: hypothetical protein LBC63_06560 [Holophagales bacterium]|jgi:hypothetical protein|nr:hypothetical protein [Holophagales bacterium]
MKLFIPAIISIALAIPLLSQSDMEYALSMQKGNKILLLGEWKVEDSAKWKQLIGSDEIYGHGFNLLGRESFKNASGQSGHSKLWSITNIDSFERWLRQRYALGGRIRWAALDNENKLIVSGIQTPTVKEFDQMLDAKGIKTPLRRVRDFLKENPGHLDATADLLKEARGRALRLMPDGADKDLDDGADLRAWGVMAAETDKVFSGAWLGADIYFFVLGQVQPERRSKLMRDVFRKHIAKVESAILLEPTNATMWNIWLWMAQGLGDYKWEKFINGIEPVVFPETSLPSSEAATWLVWEAKERKDWNTVIKFAKVARLPLRRLSASSKTEWRPTGEGLRILGGRSPVEGHPEKTVYAPHLEALLRLGDIDGANGVYDEMIRVKGKANVAAVADVAHSLGMEDLAAQWGKGEQINPAQSINMLYDLYSGQPIILIPDYGSTLQSNLQDVLAKLSLRLSQASVKALQITSSALDWKEGEDRWALVSSDRRILFQDTSVPDADVFSAILKRFEIKSDIELYRKYIEDHGSAPGIELLLAFRLITDLRYDEKNPNSPDNVRSESLAREATKFLNDVRLGNPDVLVHLPNLSDLRADSGTIKVLMDSTPKPLLSEIESLLERKPSAENLWHQWIFWNRAGGLGLSLESLVERMKPSPLSDGGILGLPISVIDGYYHECKKNGSWSKVVALLKPTWERDYQRIVAPDDVEAIILVTKNTLGDRIGIYLIEAYLNDGKPGEADEIFKAVMECGGKFKDISKIVELAKAKGHDGLAAQWEAANKAVK